MTIKLTAINGLNIAAESKGEGKSVLLLHGWGLRLESMQPVAERLAPLGYNVHAIDLPGFGRSTLPAPINGDVWGVPEYARLVADYVEKAELKPVSLVGHSFGGRISIVLGADYPHLLDKIVLTNSAGVLTPPTARQRVRQSLFRAFGAILALPGLQSQGERFRRWARNRYGSEDLKNAGPLEPIFRKVIRQDLLPYAKRIHASTLLIWGDQDQETPLWQGKALEAAIPDSGLVVLQGAGHFAYQERLTDFVRIVDKFLKG